MQKVLAIAFFFQCSLLYGRAPKMETPVKKSLTIIHEGRNALSAKVTFSNVADFDIFVLNEEPFLFIKRGGQEIQEVGPSDKRKAYTIDDYERVSPGLSVERSKEISTLFDWKSGTHTYVASISGNYSDPVTHRSWQGSAIETSFSLSTLPLSDSPVGTAKMEKDGTIVMTMNIGMTQLRYPKDHPDYKKIVLHLDGLKPGESKSVPPWPEK